MNKSCHIFFRTNSDRGTSPFGSYSFGNGIADSNILTKIIKMCPVLIVGRKQTDLIVFLSDVKASISIKASSPPVMMEMLRNLVQNISGRCRTFGGISVFIQMFGEGAIVSRYYCCSSTPRRMLGINGPFSSLLKKWNQVVTVITNKSGTDFSSGPSERYVSICPNKSKKISIDSDHLIWDNERSWIDIVFIKRFFVCVKHYFASIQLKTKLFSNSSYRMSRFSKIFGAMCSANN